MEEERPWVREWFVRLENQFHGGDRSGFQNIAVVYTSESDWSTRGPLIDAILRHFRLPERVRPFLRLWTTPFRMHYIQEQEQEQEQGQERIPLDVEFLYVGISGGT